MRPHSANLVTLVRCLLLFVVVGLAFAPGFTPRLVAVALAVVVIALDAADGAIARRLGIVSRFGAVADIVGDRLVEIVWWIALAELQVIPLVVPIIVVTRAVVVDALRSLALARGFTAFGQETMMRSTIGRVLVASRASRAAYGTVKALAFPLLFAIHALRSLPADEVASLVTMLLPLSQLLVALAVVFCLVRALPVLVESRALLQR